ncbi:MAG: hypothetical protein HFG78_14820 [Hungatella sp.]|jgi:hypothetical protein|nr:hypothetical protein [Hungatella sp.]MCI9502719.1 hypothetical protein [Hungatella sp.]MCI9637081.1 hypothetical protein [Hungatella sp.]
MANILVVEDEKSMRHIAYGAGNRQDGAVFYFIHSHNASSHIPFSAPS